MQNDRFKTVAYLIGMEKLMKAQWLLGSIRVSFPKLIKLIREDEITADINQKISEYRLSKKYNRSVRTIKRYEVKRIKPDTKSSFQ